MILFVYFALDDLTRIDRKNEKLKQTMNFREQ